MVVSALHVGFFILESILWTSPPMARLFGNTVEDAERTKVLALNQGFYNLGIAGLLIGFLLTDNQRGCRDARFVLRWASWGLSLPISVFSGPIYSALNHWVDFIVIRRSQSVRAPMLP